MGVTPKQLYHQSESEFGGDSRDEEWIYPGTASEDDLIVATGLSSASLDFIFENPADNNATLFYKQDGNATDVYRPDDTENPYYTRQLRESLLGIGQDGSIIFEEENKILWPILISLRPL